MCSSLNCSSKIEVWYDIKDCSMTRLTNKERRGGRREKRSDNVSHVAGDRDRCAWRDRAKRLRNRREREREKWQEVIPG